jgi:sugar diacid utilization regulator
VARLTQLVASPTLSSLLGYVARPRSDPDVERVALIEDLGDIERVAENAIVLVAHSAATAARSYRLDMALRVARSRSVAALVLPAGDVARITPTAAGIARRSGTAILGTGDDVDLAELAIAIGHELAGGAEAALLRTHAALRAIAAHPADGRPEALAERAGAALGVEVRLVDSEPAEGARAPVVVDGQVEGWLTAAAQEGDLAMGLEIVLHLAAGELRQGLAASRRANDLPIQSRAEVLSELLSAPVDARAQLARRARDLGVQIDGWHVAARLEFEELANPRADGDLSAYEQRPALARAALQALQESGGTWHSAHAGPSLVIVQMFREDPGAGAGGEVARAVDRALPALRPQLGTTLIRCGVGGAHHGPAGLAASAAEAKAAVTAARTAGRANTAVAFDSVGLRRTLVEWYASEVAQDAVTTVLAPLVELGGARAERLIQTLHVYLDQQGSLSRTAETLNLHRNAVGYRINQIFELLEVDQHNPDDLLLLQLACRARELS